MSDLINRQAAIDAIIADKITGNALNIIIALGDGKQAETLNEACDRHAQLLNDLPAAEPKVGKWIKNERGLKCCSICGERPLEVCYYDLNFHGYDGKEILSNYCPNCGAKMEWK